MWINDERIFNSFKNAIPADGKEGPIPTAWVTVNGRDEGQFLAYDSDGNEYVIYNPTLDKFVTEKNVGDVFEILAFQVPEGLEWAILKDGAVVEGSRYLTVGEEDGVAVDKHIPVLNYTVPDNANDCAYVSCVTPRMEAVIEAHGKEIGYDADVRR